MGESPSLDNEVVSGRKQPPGSHPSSLSSQTEPPSLAEHHDFSKDQRSTSLDRSSTDMDSTDGADLPPAGDTLPEDKSYFSFMDVSCRCVFSQLIPAKEFLLETLQSVLPWLSPH